MSGPSKHFRVSSHLSYPVKPSCPRWLTFCVRREALEGMRPFPVGTRPFRLIIRRQPVETRSFRVEKRSLSLATDAFNNNWVASFKAVDGEILLAQNIFPGRHALSQP